MINLELKLGSRLKHIEVILSEKSLSIELPKVGIKYIHKKELGVPYQIVQSYTKKKQTDGKGPLTDMQFEDYYRAKISNEIDVEKLIKEIQRDYGETVLLCACAYAVKTPRKQKYNCHRSILANILIETGKFNNVIHL